MGELKIKNRKINKIIKILNFFIFHKFNIYIFICFKITSLLD